MSVFALNSLVLVACFLVMGVWAYPDHLTASHCETTWIAGSTRFMGETTLDSPTGSVVTAPVTYNSSTSDAIVISVEASSGYRTAFQVVSGHSATIDTIQTANKRKNHENNLVSGTDNCAYQNTAGETTDLSISAYGRVTLNVASASGHVVNIQTFVIEDTAAHTPPPVDSSGSTVMLSGTAITTALISWLYRNSI